MPAKFGFIKGGFYGPPIIEMPVKKGELPYQTYEKITGKKWPGGKSPEVVSLLKEAGITFASGTAEANIELQKYLLGKPVKRAEEIKTQLAAPTVTETPEMVELKKRITEVQAKLATKQKQLEVAKAAEAVGGVFLTPEEKEEEKP